MVQVLPKAEPCVEHVDNAQAINEKYRKMSFNESESIKSSNSNRSSMEGCEISCSHSEISDVGEGDDDEQEGIFGLLYRVDSTDSEEEEQSSQEKPPSALDQTTGK